MKAIGVIAIMLCGTTHAGAATLQERIETAAPNETIRVEAGIHAGPIVINKSLTLIAENGAEIRGNGFGKVVTISADDVTLRGLRITGSGLRLSDDDAGVFITGNRAKMGRFVNPRWLTILSWAVTATIVVLVALFLIVGVAADFLPSDLLRPGLAALMVDHMPVVEMDHHEPAQADAITSDAWRAAR